MRRVLLLAALLLTACATPVDDGPAPTEVIPFSANRPGAGVPRGWNAWIITRAKASTDYELVVDPQLQRVVLHAHANRAATGLRQRLDVDPAHKPRIRWSWRVLRQIQDADVTDQYADDAPVRLLLFFDGDVSRLPPREQTLRDVAKLLTGQAIPYATLMYVWDRRAPVGQVVPHGRTQQIRMVVAGSGNERLGRWKHFERDYRRDYLQAFGAEPGRLIGVGVLTDTDNTGTTTEGYYGDIALLPPAADEPAAPAVK